MAEDSAAAGRARLRQALVDVVDVLVDRQATPELFDEWAAIVRRYAAQIAATPPEQMFFGVGPRGLMAVDGVAAAATIERPAFEQGSVSGVATFGLEHEGHAGFVHGGAIAATFDQIFGLLWAYAPAARYTRTLSVSYRRPIPFGAEVRFEARTTRLEAGRERVRATATIDGRVMARASALMVQPRPRP